MNPPLFASLGVLAWPAFIAFVAVCLAAGLALRRWEQRKGFRGDGGFTGDGSGHHGGGHDGGMSDGGGHH